MIRKEFLKIKEVWGWSRAHRYIIRRTKAYLDQTLLIKLRHRLKRCSPRPTSSWAKSKQWKSEVSNKSLTTLLIQIWVRAPKTQERSKMSQEFKSKSWVLKQVKYWRQTVNLRRLTSAMKRERSRMWISIRATPTTTRARTDNSLAAKASMFPPRKMNSHIKTMWNKCQLQRLKNLSSRKLVM